MPSNPVVDAEKDALHPNQTFVEKVYEYVKHCIMDTTLNPGQTISDTDTAAKLGISRTPVREALRQLELEGLVLHTPRRGWTVRLLHTRDIEEIFEIKESLESLLVRQATMNLSADAKAVLVSAMARMEGATGRRDREAWLEADECLQDTLYAAAGNARARQLVSSLNAQWRWMWLRLISLEDRMNHSAQEHRAILDRVLAGDPEGAAVLTSEHLANVKRYLLNLLTNFVLPFTETLRSSGGASLSSQAEARR